MTKLKPWVELLMQLKVTLIDNSSALTGSLSENQRAPTPTLLQWFNRPFSFFKPAPRQLQTQPLQKWPLQNPNRDQAMRERYANGESVETLGQAFNLSIKRIYQIIGKQSKPQSHYRFSKYNGDRSPSELSPFLLCAIAFPLKRENNSLAGWQNITP